MMYFESQSLFLVGKAINLNYNIHSFIDYSHLISLIILTIQLTNHDDDHSNNYEYIFKNHS